MLTPEGEWVPAKTSAHNFVVNIGDLMQTWSNDRWRSSEHRVANPPPEAWPGISRVSLAYFCNPDDALEIACLPGCASADNPPRYAPERQAGELSPPEDYCGEGGGGVGSASTKYIVLSWRLAPGFPLVINRFTLVPPTAWSFVEMSQNRPLQTLADSHRAPLRRGDCRQWPV